jgi:hypothetical protein
MEGCEPSAKKDFETEQSGVFAAPGSPLGHFLIGPSGPNSWPNRPIHRVFHLSFLPRLGYKPNERRMVTGSSTPQPDGSNPPGLPGWTVGPHSVLLLGDPTESRRAVRRTLVGVTGRVMVTAASLFLFWAFVQTGQPRGRAGLAFLLASILFLIGWLTIKSVDRKKCPQCAETIKYKAVLCKHCGYDFAAAV